MEVLSHTTSHKKYIIPAKKFVPPRLRNPIQKSKSNESIEIKWLDIDMMIRRPIEDRFEIVNSIIRKLEAPLKPGVSKTVLQIYHLRLSAIILAFFNNIVERSKYRRYLDPIFPTDFYFSTTPQEFEVIDHFWKSISLIKNGFLNQGTQRFIVADKLFGELRIANWKA